MREFNLNRNLGHLCPVNTKKWSNIRNSNLLEHVYYKVVLNLATLNNGDHREGKEGWVSSRNFDKSIS